MLIVMAPSLFNRAAGYEEFMFQITPEELSGCTLRGDLYTSGDRIDGSWRITFP